jgi:Family of unknown function (DUF6879)
VIPHRITSLDDPQFMALFTSVRESWRRLETLQRYDVDYEREEFNAFLRGESPDSTPGPWQEMIAAHAAAGRALARVHVIQMPPVDYIRYELACYPVNAAAGERIQVIPVRPGEWPRGVARRDYWIFDSREVWYMAYDRAGRFRYTQRCNWALGWALRSWNAAWAQSMPLADVAAPLQPAQ